MFFDITVAIFLGIDLRRIRWQPFDDDFRMLRQVCFDLIATMNLAAIPNQNPLALDLSPDMFEGDDHAVAVNRFVKMALVNFARQRQPDGGREGTPFGSDAAQHWRLSTQRPGPPQRGEKRKPRLIVKNNHCTESTRFFFIRGQSLRSHARIHFSSRSAAAGCGVCSVKPSWRSKRGR